MTAIGGASGQAARIAPGRRDQRQGLRLHCRGVVQGVGFRPAVARLAAALGLEGCLANIPGAVRIELAGPRPVLERFVARLEQALPAAARLEGLQLEWLAPPLPRALSEARGLRIAATTAQPLGVGLVAPSLVADRAPCRRCRRELRDSADRRCGYAFISCCDCGPRYSIATAEPFARDHTTLAAFSLCPSCQREFDDPADRRFHAETIGCPACGPRLRLLDAGGQPLAAAPATDPLTPAVELLRSGAILALQGVGGFQLLVKASDAAAVARLRSRKRRPHKPFALLIDTPGRLAGLVDPSPAELAALEDPAAPIVLLPCPNDAHGTVLAGVAPGAPGLGVMLPASPLHLLLAEAFAGPLVATSGNRSGEPLCIDAAEALARLGGIADAFLVHDRRIARPLDDSLLQLIDGRPALLRRARGFAPEALALPRMQPSMPLSHQAPDAAGGSAAATNCATADPPAALLALGSDLKSAPALAVGERLWLAPFLGDLADSRCLERWRAGLAEQLQQWRPNLAAVAIDAHPQYLSSQLAGSLLQTPQRREQHGQGRLLDTCAGDPPRSRLQTLPVAHHRAHGLAVAAEHGLPLPLPALVLDGLGYGGGPVPLWGCELLWLEAWGARRLASLRPLPLPGGERAVREPRRSALGLLWAAGLLEHPGAAVLGKAFETAERNLLLQALETGCQSPWCSSAGRLFDAVASLLNLVQRASHEAHAGLLLQAAASRAADEAGAYPMPLLPAADVSGPRQPDLPLLDWQPLLAALLDDLAAGRSQELCAARFQAGLIRGLTLAVAACSPEHAGASGNSIVLAGGCFQNRLLLEGLIGALRQHGLRPHWSEQLPGNDGGLAAGQILALQAELTRPASRT